MDMFKTVDELKDALCERGMDEAVVFDGDTHYVSAVVGFDYCNERVIYDFDKMVEFLLKENGCTLDDAIEWIEYNTDTCATVYGRARTDNINEF